LFNCGGFLHDASTLDCNEAAFSFSVDLNVRAMYRTMRFFLPVMIGNGGESIVNIASVRPRSSLRRSTSLMASPGCGDRRSDQTVCH
jgi:NAD(P)-dependent dehydrogenase (short-subunit alcohol dehydrogenase family)